MDATRFDLLAKGIGRPSRRRVLLRGVGASIVLSVLGQAAVTPRPAAARHCRFEGCGCTTGTRHPCAQGLSCCSQNPGLPGGAGVCTQDDC